MIQTRLTRRHLIAGLAASSAGALVLAASGCAAPPSTAGPTAAPAAPKVPAPSPTIAPKSAATVPPGSPAADSTLATAPAGPPTVASPAPLDPTKATTTPSAAAKAANVADLVVVKGASPADITRAAVEALGGIGRFVKAGQTVVIKPNMCTALAPEYGATTNPEVVAALVELCKSAGAAKVKVFDYAWGNQATVYAASGIEAAVKAAGGEMVAITPLKWKKTEFAKAKNLKSQDVFEDVLTADVLINVPIAKNHGLSTLTLGMKNLMGVVRSREVYHSAFGRNLCDLVTQVRPAFTLVDAVRVMTRNGPGGGSLDYVEKRDTVIASTDIVAVDAYATTLFGMKPDALESVRLGQAEGLGTFDLASLKVADIKR